MNRNSSKEGGRSSPGAGRGIGRSNAKPLAFEGAKIAVLSPAQASATPAVAEIRADGGTAIAVVCEGADAGHLIAAVRRVVAASGGVDIVIKSAFAESVVDARIRTLHASVDRNRRGGIAPDVMFSAGGAPRSIATRARSGTAAPSPPVPHDFATTTSTSLLATPDGASHRAGMPKRVPGAAVISARPRTVA